MYVVGISTKAQDGPTRPDGADERARPGRVGACIRDRRRAAGLTSVQPAEAAAVSASALRDDSRCSSSAIRWTSA